MLMMDDTPGKVNALARALGLTEGEPWSWTKRYNPGLFDHMHALGVIAANYNRLETVCACYLTFFMGSQMTAAEAGAYLFERLSNAEGINLLKQLYTTEVGGTILADRLDWFVSGYGKCAESRNILMHSEPHGASYNALQLVSALALRKASKNNPGVHNFISLELHELRQVADDIDRFATYGFELALYQIARKSGGTITLGDRQLSPPLPDRPPEPIHLKLGPQTNVKDSSPPPPQS